MTNNAIDDLKLSVRARNCLKNAGVQTIEEMTLIDLETLKNCGQKTKDEIIDTIMQLVSMGRYSQEFIEAYLKDYNYDFINSLNVSVRARNILKKLNIKNENDLLMLNHQRINAVKNAGVNTVNEIINYIKQNRKELEDAAISKGIIEYSVNINKILNFSGNTVIETIPINVKIKDELEKRNIITVLDLIMNKTTLDDSIMPLYNAVYNYFYNIAYGPLALSVSSELSDLYINLPFNMLELMEQSYIKIGDLIEYVITNFSKLELDEKLNSKLFLFWINSFKIVDKKKYFVNKLMLKEKEYEILSLRSTKTLEEVGHIFGVTRERIRQIEAKAIAKVKRNYRLIPFKLIDKKKLYYVNELDDFYNLLFYINIVTNENSHILIKKEEKSYYLPTFYIDKLNQFIHNNISQFENQGFLEIDINEWPDIDILNKVLEYLNYNIYNNKITKKLTKRLQVRYAMKYLNKPISISSIDDQMEIVKAVKHIFGNEFETGRGMEALIADAGVRIDSGKYSASDNIEPLSKETLSKIIQYVKERKIINTRDLFIDFGDELIEHNLNNETILYRYLKENISDKLYFHGVSAVISSDPQLAGWGDLAIRIMKKSHKPINKLNFIVKNSITETVYNMLPVNYGDIIIWSSKELYLKSLLKVPDNVKSELIDYIKNKQIVKFDEIRSKINKIDINLLFNNNVKTNDNLYYFLINILSDDCRINKYNEEIRYKENIKTIIEEVYDETEELTL